MMGYYINKMDPQGTIAVDDTIQVQGSPATAGSRILEGFLPLFSAEAVTRLEQAGEKVSGKCHVGEFGLDLLGESSFFGPLLQDGHLASASAQLVAEGSVKAALNVDANGTPRRAAAVAGVDLIKPTYGAVSRRGVISTASSGETVTVTARDAREAARILSLIAGHDEKDGTSLPQVRYSYDPEGGVQGLKVARIAPLLEGAEDAVQARIEEISAALENLGAALETIEADWTGQAQTAWQILMCAESCSNLGRFDGVKYGRRAREYRDIEDLYDKSRSEGLGFNAKAVILYGSEVLSKQKYEACYDRALRVRRVIAEELARLFARYDALLCPAISTFAPAPCAPTESFARAFGESRFTAPASLTGIPAMVTGGVQFMAAHHGEETLLKIARALEKGEE